MPSAPKMWKNAPQFFRCLRRNHPPPGVVPLPPPPKKKVYPGIYLPDWLLTNPLLMTFQCFVLLSIPWNSVGNFTLLTDCFHFSCLKFKGLCFPSISNLIDWCCLGTSSPIITSFAKFFSRANSTFLHRNCSFPRTESARAFPLHSIWAIYPPVLLFHQKLCWFLTPATLQVSSS